MLTTDENYQFNTRLQINNFPETHTQEMIRAICKVFGTVKTIELVTDPIADCFKGTVNVEFSTEAEAKRAQSAMMGLKIDNCVLFVKKLSSIGHPGASDCGEVFKQLIDDKPTSCLCIKNLFCLEEMKERIDYKELEFDV